MAHKAKQSGHIDAYIGARIKERRLLLGLTLEDLAKTLGLTYQQVQKYEKGTNRVAVSRLYDISLALQTHIGFFLHGISPNISPHKNPPTVDDLPISKDALQLAVFYTKIKNPALKRQILKMAVSMAEATDE